MTVSKRVRFAVLHRDNHTCQYCGRTAPEVRLTIDHVIPTVLGGTDDPSNLVTACEPCNSGKTSSSPDETTVAAVDESARRWAQAMQLAADEMSRNRREAGQRLAVWRSRWDEWHFTEDKAPIPLPDDWEASVSAFIDAGCPLDVLISLIPVAMKSKSREKFRYYAGCAWNTVRQLQARATEIANGSTAPRVATDPAFGDHETAYWTGRATGYSKGYDDGWEAGQLTGGRDGAASTDPAPLAAILQQLKEGPPDGEDPRG